MSTVKHVDMKITCCQVANAALILIMVPFFNVAVYPLFAKCNLLKTSLQRIAVGFFCAALSFGVSGLLDLQLEVFWISYPEEIKKSNQTFNLQFKYYLCFRKLILTYQKKDLVKFKHIP